MDSFEFGKNNLNFELITFSVRQGLYDLIENTENNLKKEIFSEFCKNLSIKDKNVTYESSKLFLSSQENLLANNHFEVVNMMVKCQLQCVQKDNFYFDLNTLKNKDDEMYYSHSSVPSMMMPFGTQSCTARVTTSGYITMTGGKSVEEVIFWMSVFIHKILYYLSYFTPDNTFVITGFTVHNKVCKTRLPYKINLYGLSEYLRKTQISFNTRNRTDNVDTTTKINYNPDKISLIYIQMLSIRDRKVTFSLGPKGGIVVLAYLHNYEILLLSYGISMLIRDFIVENLDLPKSLSCKPKSRKRKIKNNEKWKKLTEDKNIIV